MESPERSTKPALKIPFEEIKDSLMERDWLEDKMSEEVESTVLEKKKNKKIILKLMKPFMFGWGENERKLVRGLVGWEERIRLCIAFFCSFVKHGLGVVTLLDKEEKKAEQVENVSGFSAK